MIELFVRDISLAVRSGGGFGLALIFFLIVVVLLPLALGPDQSTLALVAPGVLWLGALLACLLSLDRIFGLDYEDGSLDLFATSPLPLEAVYIAKASAHWLTTGLPLALVAPVLGVLLNLSFETGKALCFSLLLGTPALSLIGAFGATLTLGVKRGGLLLSLLVLPLYVPTLIFGAQVVRFALLGQTFDVPLIMVLSISLGAVAILPFASGAALRMNLR
tara:strand:+ start:1905 stop:2561 length:657 start_codon:yes stop_codon:yes gene_type:complete